MALRALSGGQLRALLDNGTVASKFLDQDVLRELKKYVEDLDRDLHAGQARWRDFTMFWPPRAAEALAGGSLVPFFGAGVSASAGFPTWGALLQPYFDPNEALASDEELDNDFLTKAELAAQRVGSNRIQNQLREECLRHSTPTASHFLLAALAAPVMITTNYDWLLETAWRTINPQVRLDVAVNDADLAGLPKWTDYVHGGNKALLLKIHGCGQRTSEQLVLTRADYRHHYRVNSIFFQAVADVLAVRHTVFLGFSHRDPEVGRLIEDSIYRYEQKARAAAPLVPKERPHFYSFQFNMRRHTPEVFAAKGLVALESPIVLSPAKDAKTASVCRSMADLILASAYKDILNASLEGDLSCATDEISADVFEALSKLERYEPEALRILMGKAPSIPLDDFIVQLGSVAAQGVYVLDDKGKCVEFAVPTGLDKAERNKISEFHDRPYFRVARTYREPFVSDVIKSKYNNHATVFFCKPILNASGFAGLLFAATHPGAWDAPLKAAKQCWGKRLDFILIDSQGVLLLPPSDEIPIDAACRGPAGNENENLNLGYDFERLMAFSRRDRMVKHINDNIVPLSQDDDVHRLAPDVEYYSVVCVVPGTRWKLAVARPMLKLK